MAEAFVQMKTVRLFFIVHHICRTTGKRLNCYEKEPMHKSALECEKQTCCEERNERQQQNKKRANSEDYPSSPSPVFACRFFTVVFLFDRCNSTESLRLVLIERFSLDCRIGIGFGFGFGFTTSFGWLVYLLWFWFYDSQVKTALTVPRH